MVLKTVLRAVWVACAFVIAAGIGLAVLFALGSIWMGDELRKLAPDSPAMQLGAPWLSVVLFTGTVSPALTALPALGAVIAGEVLRIRSWIYYILAGGASLAAIPLLIANADTERMLTSQFMAIFIAAGFAGGFIYWSLAGARA